MREVQTFYEQAGRGDPHRLDAGKAFGSKLGGSHWKRVKENEGGANLPSFLSAKNYSPFISKDLGAALKSPIVCRVTAAATPDQRHEQDYD